jgi:transposase
MVCFGVITRARDEILRSVLVVGATAVIRQLRRGQCASVLPWLVELHKRKPPKVAVVALANKIARIAWKLIVSGERNAAQGMAVGTGWAA